MQDKGVSCIRKTSKKYCADETKSFTFLRLSVHRALPAVWRLCVLCVWAHGCVSPRVPSGSLPIHSCLSSSCDWPCLPPSFKTFQWLKKKKKTRMVYSYTKDQKLSSDCETSHEKPLLGPQPHLQPQPRWVAGVQPHWPLTMSLSTLCSSLPWGLCTRYSLCLSRSSHLLLPLQYLVQAVISFFFLNYFFFLFDICHDPFFLFVKTDCSSALIILPQLV